MSACGHPFHLPHHSRLPALAVPRVRTWPSRWTERLADLLTPQPLLPQGQWSLSKGPSRSTELTSVLGSPGRALHGADLPTPR